MFGRPSIHIFIVLHHYKDDQTNELTNILSKKKECFRVMKNISIRVEIEARTHGIAMK